MADTLTVTVIIPTYNRAHLIARAINSALVNLAPGDEIVVVDDASTDHTAEIVRGFPAPVRYIAAAHGGAGAARNVGLLHATGDLVAFLDSDDEWSPDHLHLQRQYLQLRSDVLFVFTNFCSQLDTGEVEHFFLERWHKDPRGWNEILGPGVWFSDLAPLPPGRVDFRVHVGDMFLQEMQSDYMATSTVIVRRREAGPALRFAEDIRISEDKECFGRLAGAGLGAYFDCETSTQWGHAGPRVSDTNDYALVTSRLLLFDRIWANDVNFVRQYGAELEAARQAQHLKRGRWLLARGRTREARADLRRAPQAPWAYRALALLPEPLAHGLLNCHRRWRGQAAL